jgi:hypothetical protein
MILQYCIHQQSFSFIYKVVIDPSPLLLRPLSAARETEVLGENLPQ